jgi:hypothetical protein
MIEDVCFNNPATVLRSWDFEVRPVKRIGGPAGTAMPS